jgi:phospholipid-binding lipoprotein MlaA
MVKPVSPPNGIGVVALLFATLIAGCASTPDEYADPRDPVEDFNRAVYRFNDELDKAIIKPVAQGYRAITPAKVDRGVTNFFSNLQDVGSAVNNLLQLKVERSSSDVGRVLVNSTIGILGLVDVASNLDLPKYGEDFGQTLGVWGVGPGPFLVLPVLGPSSGRDAVGLIGDWFTDPVTYVSPWEARAGLQGLRGIDARADLLTASKVVEEAALDPYEFTKDAYLQKRRSDVYDGVPPLEPDDY